MNNFPIPPLRLTESPQTNSANNKERYRSASGHDEIVVRTESKKSPTRRLPRALTKSPRRKSPRRKLRHGGGADGRRIYSLGRSRSSTCVNSKLQKYSREERGSSEEERAVEVLEHENNRRNKIINGRRPASTQERKERRDQSRDKEGGRGQSRDVKDEWEDAGSFYDDIEPLHIRPNGLWGKSSKPTPVTAWTETVVGSERSLRSRSEKEADVISKLVSKKLHSATANKPTAVQQQDSEIVNEAKRLGFYASQIFNSYQVGRIASGNIQRLTRRVDVKSSPNVRTEFSPEITSDKLYVKFYPAQDIINRSSPITNNVQRSTKIKAIGQSRSGRQDALIRNSNAKSGKGNSTKVTVQQPFNDNAPILPLMKNSKKEKALNCVVHKISKDRKQQAITSESNYEEDDDDEVQSRNKSRTLDSNGDTGIKTSSTQPASQNDATTNDKPFKPNVIMTRHQRARFDDLSINRRAHSSSSSSSVSSPVHAKAGTWKSDEMNGGDFERGKGVGVTLVEARMDTNQGRLDNLDSSGHELISDSEFFV